MAFNTGMTTALMNPGMWSPGATPPPAATPGIDWGSYAGAASQAIGTTGQLISQAAQAAAQRDFGAGQNDLDRATKAQLAKMQLSESRLESNQAAKSNAYKMLLAAFSNQMNNQNATFSNARNSNSAMDQILSSAMLRR